MKKLAVPILAAVASLPLPALAETITPRLDPNEVICRTERQIGSRLGASRRCATRAQWLEDDRQQRTQLSERQTRQTQPSCMNPAERAAGFGRSAVVQGSTIGCQ
jgi:hypothetical protein